MQAVEIEAQIIDDLTRLNDALPGARFIVIEPFWCTDERPRSVEVINGWVRDAAAGIGADDIPGASHCIEHHPEWMTRDGLHPNDDGYAAIAGRMNAELAKLDLQAALNCEGEQTRRRRPHRRGHHECHPRCPSSAARA